ncbi:helix-turn-helix domain-containing protein [Kribbella sp. NBC_01505]|uniref:helix-turn-helix domain-containing protein n=1 Tax=Kribbella sp. NBC_01505 TaxID=2903580 RepID=UPI0038672CAD
MLESLGIDAAQEELYEHVLTRPGRKADDLPASPAALDELVAMRLLRCLDGRYSAVPPELALQHFLDDRRLELERAAARVHELERLHRATPDPAGQVPIQIVPGDEAPMFQAAIYASLRHQLRAFETPPYGKRILPADAEPAADAIHRGVRHRIVYSRQAIEEQGLEILRVTLPIGEEARVVGAVPMRLAIFDDTVATMPIRTGRPVTEGILVVRPSALLDALIALFEQVWSTALPLNPDLRDELDPEDDRTLIALLAAGMGDQAIARQLGISLRTVGRRVQRVQNSLNAATRFQAGVAVGLSRQAGGESPDHPSKRV